MADFFFHDFHAPGLLAGDYSVDVSLRAAPPSGPPSKDGQALSPETRGAKTVAFSVKGERFALRDAEVVSTWPPRSAQGDFHGHLPHVILRRKTLPWERSGKPATETTPVPWLFVLLLEDEGNGGTAPTLRTTTADQLHAQPGPFLHAFLGTPASFTNETQQDPKEPLSLLDLDAASVASQLPALAEHLRYCTVARHPGGQGSEVAVVMGTQVIRRGASTDGGLTHPLLHYTAHLVSVEACFDNSGARRPMPTGGRVTLISLYRWRFTSHDQGNFLGWCQALNGIAGSPSGGRAVYQLPSATVSGSDDAAREALAFLAAGSVPSLHHFAQGDIRRSWYRGPLVAGVPSDGALVASLPVPSAHPDPLLLYSTATGLFDASYATAWQLGRFLLLRDRPVAAALDRWKRARGRAAARRRGELEHQFLPHAAAIPQVPDFPSTVTDFLGALGRLDGVPNACLVPDPELLPPESIRFVEVDAAWVLALLDGALSVGRIGSGERIRDADRHRARAAAPRLSGFLVHSKIVDHFPELQVSAASGRGGTTTQLPSVTVRRLTPRVLLALFEVGAGQALDQATLRLPPEAMHFAVEENPTSGAWEKKLRLADPRRVSTELLADGHLVDAQRVLRIDQLIDPAYWTPERLTKAGADATTGPMRFTPSEFAYQMLGAPPVFTISRA